MWTTRFITVFAMALIFPTTLGAPDEALAVPLCSEIVEVSMIDILQPGFGGVEEPALPAPLDDYSEILNIDSASLPMPPIGESAHIETDFAISRERTNEFLEIYGEAISKAIAESDPATRPDLDEDGLQISVAAFVVPATPVTDCVVEIWDRQFRPAKTVVDEGATIYWLNQGVQDHRVRPSGSGVCNFDTGVLNPGEADSHEFDEPADFPCNYNDPGFDRLRLEIFVCSDSREEFPCQ